MKHKINLKAILSIALFFVFIFSEPVSVYAGFMDFSDPDRSNIEKTGDVLQLLIPLTGVGMALVRDNDEGKFQFLKSLITNTVVTQGLKWSVKKERPNGRCCNSFPSWHTSVAFQGAAFIQKRYGWGYGTPAYIGASFVGYSRVYADKHYVEDVLAGAAIGILSSYYFTTPIKAVMVSPIASNGIYGLIISKEW